MKYLLTTSEDKCVIIAEVPNNHVHNDREYKISESMLRTNINNGDFIELDTKTEDGGRIWGYASDIQ